MSLYQNLSPSETVTPCIWFGLAVFWTPWNQLQSLLPQLPTVLGPLTHSCTLLGTNPTSQWTVFATAASPLFSNNLCLVAFLLSGTRCKWGRAGFAPWLGDTGCYRGDPLHQEQLPAVGTESCSHWSGAGGNPGAHLAFSFSLFFKLGPSWDDAARLHADPLFSVF